MKQKIYPLLYTVAIFLSGLFYIFLCDLAYFDRIAKNGGIWGHSQQVCMAHYDVLCILGVLGLLMWLGYILVPVYKSKTFFIPLLGMPVFLVFQLILCSILKTVCL